MTSYQAQVPTVVGAYFGPVDHPIIAETFTPGIGWKRTGFPKRVSRSWLRKLRKEGVTAVALAADKRLADFTIAEILRS